MWEAILQNNRWSPYRDDPIAAPENKNKEPKMELALGGMKVTEKSEVPRVGEEE